MYGFLSKAWFPNFPAFFIGDVVSLGYLFIYWRFSENRRHVTKVIGTVFAALAVPTFYVTLGLCGYTDQTRMQVWKTHGLCFCDVTVTALSTIMLRNFVHTFKQRSAASINPRALTVGTFNTSGWFSFGVMTSNWVIAGPQVFVILLHLAAWAMYVAFRNNCELEDGTATEDDNSGTLQEEVSPKLELVIRDGPEISTATRYEALDSPCSSSIDVRPVPIDIANTTQ